VFFGKQVVAVTFAIVYAFVMTYLMLMLIDKITPVRTSPRTETNGLDDSLHGETAYLEPEPNSKDRIEDSII
jgi:Amt family ammonium transporter